jgi:hypothetical protein
MNSKRYFLKSILVVGALAIGALNSAAKAEIVQVPHGSAYASVTPSQREVDNKIQKVVMTAYRDGFRQIVADERGAIMNNGRPATFRVRLKGGTEYRFAARCDSDCNDLDLVLEDEFGSELMADRDDDDTPSFTFRVRSTGDYVLRLELADGDARRSQVGAVVIAR